MDFMSQESKLLTFPDWQFFKKDGSDCKRQLINNASSHKTVLAESSVPAELPSSTMLFV